MTAAGGVLATSVTLRDPSNAFRLSTFPAGSTPPAWAQALITNPKAWESAPESTPTPDGDDEDLIGGEETSQTASPGSNGQDGGAGDPERLSKPSKGGRRDAWVAYANQEGVDFADDATRDEIIAAVEAAEGSSE